MKAFAFTEPIGISDVVFKVITEQGDLFCDPFWKYFSTKAKESVINDYQKKGYDVEWVQYPRNHEGIKQALKAYQLTIGIGYDCREY